MDLASRAPVLLVWYLPQRSLRLIHCAYEVKTIFITLKCYLPFSLSFSKKMYSEISQSYMMCIDIISFTANGMCACVSFCFKLFSVLSSSMINS